MGVRAAGPPGIETRAYIVGDLVGTLSQTRGFRLGTRTLAHRLLSANFFLSFRAFVSCSHML